MAWGEKQREYQRKYIEKHRLKRREYDREYARKRRATNPLPLREAAHKYYRTHKAERREYSRKYYHKNLEMCRANSREKARRDRKKLRAEVLKAYGEKCWCCGETEKVFLSIDHVKGGGNKHRRALGNTSLNFYYWLKRNNYPQGEFRCLCMNCQIGFARCGTCPHQAT